MGYKRYSLFSPSEWLWEFMTSFLSLGLLVAMGVIFWQMDGKPLSKWTSGISLNATIAVLSTACAAALMHGVSEFIGQLKWLHFKNGPKKLAHLEMFDSASRGPWGALCFLGTIKWNLATLGALITISRLAFGPLAQQVIKVEPQYISTASDAATFGYAQAYDRGSTLSYLG